MSTEIREIGPFRILGELGQGGMGRVYKALQPSVNRVVALKVLPEVLEKDETAVRRFVQEAETAANLTHLNIVKVWDASVHQPPYYIAMEFLEGGTLADRLASGPIPLDKAVKIMGAVCSALDHAHEQGVIHRDIKPANIMFDGKGRPVVTDFGIARASDHTRLTATGSIFGTPDFMSPEQAKGHKVDSRSDLYSAAVVFYEMLAGRPPFVSDNPLVTMNQIINNDVPPPSTFAPNIPQTIDTVLSYALAKNPDERYQSGTELAQALHTAITLPVDMPTAQETLMPTGGAVPQPLEVPPIIDQLPWWRRKAVLVSFLALVVIGIGGLLTTQLAGPGRQKPAGGVSVTVPVIVGRTTAEAKVALKGAGLQVGDLREQSDASLPKGQVISCDPSPGKEVKKGDSVSLVVSSGPRPTARALIQCPRCSAQFASQADLDVHYAQQHKPIPAKASLKPRTTKPASSESKPAKESNASQATKKSESQEDTAKELQREVERKAKEKAREEAEKALKDLF